MNTRLRISSRSSSSSAPTELSQRPVNELTEEVAECDQNSHSLPDLQAKLERASRFGHNFSQVQVSADPAAIAQPKPLIAHSFEQQTEPETNEFAQPAASFSPPIAPQPIQRQLDEEEFAQARVLPTSLTPASDRSNPTEAWSPPHPWVTTNKLIELSEPESVASATQQVQLSQVPDTRIQRQCGVNMSCPEDMATEETSTEGESPSTREEFDALVSELSSGALDDSARRTAVQSLATWCRENLPDRNLLQVYLNAPTPVEAALVAPANATIAALEDQATSMSMSQEDTAAATAAINAALTQIREARRLGAQEKTQTIGQLAVDIARMEFLLGWMYQGGLSRSGATGWETENRGNNRGEFPTHYQDAMETHGRGTGAPWCTSFAGYAYRQIGFNFDFNEEVNERRRSSTARSIFWSGLRLRQWALTGQTTSGRELTPTGQRVADPETSGALIDRSDWATLTRRLRSLSETEQRHQAVSEFFETRTTPQAGDFLILGRNNNFKNGGSSHTALVERYDAATQTILTVEGNADNAVRARQIDLTNPDQVSQIVFITRLGVEYFNPTDPTRQSQSTAASEEAGTTQASEASDELICTPDSADTIAQQPMSPASTVTADEILNSIREVNARLVELSSSQGWINSSDAQGTVQDWIGGSSEGEQQAMGTQ